MPLSLPLDATRLPADRDRRPQAALRRAPGRLRGRARDRHLRRPAPPASSATGFKVTRSHGAARRVRAPRRRREAAPSPSAIARVKETPRGRRVAWVKDRRRRSTAERQSARMTPADGDVRARSFAVSRSLSGVAGPPCRRRRSSFSRARRSPSLAQLAHPLGCRASSTSLPVEAGALEDRRQPVEARLATGTPRSPSRADLALAERRVAVAVGAERRLRVVDVQRARAGRGRPPRRTRRRVAATAVGVAHVVARGEQVAGVQADAEPLVAARGVDQRRRAPRTSGRASRPCPRCSRGAGGSPRSRRAPRDHLARRARSPRRRRP